MSARRTSKDKISRKGLPAYVEAKLYLFYIINLNIHISN